MLALRNLTGLTGLNLCGCENVTSEGLLAVSSLTALTSLKLNNSKMTSEGLRTVSSLTALTTLNLYGCRQVTSEGLRAVSSLTALDLTCCKNVTFAGKLALHTAFPYLKIVNRHQ